MKILYITTHLNKGGISTYLSSLAIGLEKLGHKIIIASSGGDSLAEILENNISHIHIPIRTKKEISPSVLFSYFILKKFLSNNSVDIIHAHTRVTQVLAYFLSRKFKIPVITTCHGFFKPRWHRRKFPCWGDKVIAISSQVKNHLISDFKVKEENIYLIHSGVDLRKFKDYTVDEIDDLKSEIGIPKGFLVVGSVGRFSVVKGLEYLIKAAFLVLRQNNKVIFLLIGYGKDELKLKKIVKENNIGDKVIFFRPLKDSYQYLCVMDIFVMPSIQEGLGLSILEAQAQGVPVIASNVGGIPDIIQNEITGILVKPQDELEISKAILRLIQDNLLYSRIRSSAHNRIREEFSLEKMIRKTEEIYKDLLC